MAADDREFFAEVVERQRSRAKTAAGVTATGAGALAAGLIFAPASLDLGEFPRALAIAAFGLLLLSICLFAGGFLYRPREASAPDAATISKQISASIWHLTLTGGVVAAGALTITLIAVIFNFFSGGLTSVTVAISGVASGSIPCNALPDLFDGKVPTSDLRTGSVSVPVLVNASYCDPHRKGSTWIYLPRDQITISER